LSFQTPPSKGVSSNIQKKRRKKVIVSDDLNRERDGEAKKEERKEQKRGYRFSASLGKLGSTNCIPGPLIYAVMSVISSSFNWILISSGGLVIKS
jgi:hypothetical protein